MGYELQVDSCSLGTNPYVRNLSTRTWIAVMFATGSNLTAFTLSQKRQRQLGYIAAMFSGPTTIIHNQPRLTTPLTLGSGSK